MEFSESRPIWGLSGFIVGVLALVVVGLLVSGQFDPPSKSVGTTVGEIAAEIKSSAKRALSGAPAPEPVEAQDPSLKDLLQLVLPVLAAMAAILGAVGGIQERTAGAGDRGHRTWDWRDPDAVRDVAGLALRGRNDFGGDFEQYR